MKKLLVAVAVSIACVSGIAHADMSKKHPYYLHTLGDLREAKWLLKNHQSAQDSGYENIAIQHIETAIKDITQAGISDGKDMNDHSDADVPEDRMMRLRQASDILEKAHSDVKLEKEDPAAPGLRHLVLRETYIAGDQVKRAMMDDGHAQKIPPSTSPHPLSAAH